MERQVQAAPESWAKYGEHDVTPREHAQELRTYLGLLPLGLSDFSALVRELPDLAKQTDKDLLMAAQALENLRQQRVMVIEPTPKPCRVYRAL